MPMKLYYDPKLKELSRDLRKKRVLSEVLLWNNLKGRKMLGHQFARQKPIGRYIVDFYCPELRLVIEIDGESHRKRFQQDVQRQKDLEAMGLEVLRFADRKVKRDILNVLRGIDGWIEEKRKTSSDSRCKSAEGTTP
jgi:very-short-patch-repair endonuclease